MSTSIGPCSKLPTANALERETFSLSTIMALATVSKYQKLKTKNRHGKGPVLKSKDSFNDHDSLKCLATDDARSLLAIRLMIISAFSTMY